MRPPLEIRGEQNSTRGFSRETRGVVEVFVAVLTIANSFQIIVFHDVT
jgi:hypothetical protein